MIQSERPKELCQEIVQGLIQTYNWQLFSEKVFVETVFSDEQWIKAEYPQAACVNVYCKEALYPACIGTFGVEKRHQGFCEMSHYMHVWASKRLSPEILHDVVQDAILNLYQNVYKCHTPGAILQFVSLARL